MGAVFPVGGSSRYEGFKIWVILQLTGSKWRQGVAETRDGAGFWAQNPWGVSISCMRTRLGGRTQTGTGVTGPRGGLLCASCLLSVRLSHSCITSKMPSPTITLAKFPSPKCRRSFFDGRILLAAFRVYPLRSGICNIGLYSHVLGSVGKEENDPTHLPRICSS